MPRVEGVSGEKKTVDKNVNIQNRSTPLSKLMTGIAVKVPAVFDAVNPFKFMTHGFSSSATGSREDGVIFFYDFSPGILVCPMQQSPAPLLLRSLDDLFTL